VLEVFPRLLYLLSLPATPRVPPARRIESANRRSTTKISVGTSLRVYPAAGLAAIAASGGARLVIVNAEPTPYDDMAAEVVREPISEAMPRLLHAVTAAGSGGVPS
jgi:NAD-dependent SIR2 family protein deacetylase